MEPTITESVDGMHPSSRTRAADLVAEWKESLNVTEGKRRIAAFRNVDTLLQRLRQEGLMEPGWRLDWDTEAKVWRTRFTVAGGAAPREMTAAEFTFYVQGFHDRRVAVMNRPPK